METVRAVEEMLEDRDVGIWFGVLAEGGPHAIEAQAWQMKALLDDAGIGAPLRDVQDAMLELAHDLLPDSAAGDDPRDRLTGDLGRWASAQPPEVREKLAAMLEHGYQDAWESGLQGFRHYLRGRCIAATREDAA